MHFHQRYRGVRGGVGRCVTVGVRFLRRRGGQGLDHQLDDGRFSLIVGLRFSMMVLNNVCEGHRRGEQTGDDDKRGNSDSAQRELDHFFIFGSWQTTKHSCVDEGGQFSDSA